MCQLCTPLVHSVAICSVHFMSSLGCFTWYVSAVCNVHHYFTVIVTQVPRLCQTYRHQVCLRYELCRLKRAAESGFWMVRCVIDDQSTLPYSTRLGHHLWVTVCICCLQNTAALLAGQRGHSPSVWNVILYRSWWLTTSNNPTTSFWWIRQIDVLMSDN